MPPKIASVASQSKVDFIVSYQEHIFMTSQPEVSMCYIFLRKIISHVEQEEKENEVELVENMLVRKCASKPQKPDDCWHESGW